MKRLITALTALITLATATNAMSYEQAREQALFLTDKMAYELNLTEEQYDAAYEVFGRPRIYVTYRGGHSWRHNGGRSWYKGRTFHHGPGVKGHGLRDRFDRGDFHRKGPRGDKHINGNRPNRPKHDAGRRPQHNRPDKNRPQSNFRNGRNNYRNHRESSTRTTVKPNHRGANSASFKGGRRPSNTGMQRKPSNTFTPKRGNSRPSFNRSGSPRKSIGGGNRSTGNRNNSARGGGNRGGGNRGGHR